MNAEEIARLVQGMLQQNNETLLSQINLRLQAAGVSSPPETAPQVRISEQNDMEYEIEEEEEDDTNERNQVFSSGSEAWADVLPSGKRQAFGRGMNLVGRIAFPPPLSLVQGYIKEQVAIEGVPETPAPRRSMQDRGLAGTQKKLEAALTKLVELAEKEDGSLQTDIGLTAALVRSAYEDINEARRRMFAGRQAYKLDARGDVTQNKLLSSSEELKLRQGKGKGKGFRPSAPFRGQNQQQEGSQQAKPVAWRNLSQGKGQGRQSRSRSRSNQARDQHQ